MNVKEININLIKNYERNAKKHDDRQIKNVAESIKQFGFVQPVVVDRDNVIIIGHCRFAAAKKLKMSAVPCVCIEDLTDEQVQKLRLLDNKLNESEWDFNLLAEDVSALDFSDFDVDWGLFDDVNADDFGDDFSLNDGGKNEICQMTLTLHEKQKELIEYVIEHCGDCVETFGNTNRQGNQVYEVVRQWAEQRKSM